MKILIDTREQNPLKFKGCKVRLTTLKSGDYSLYGYTSIVAIERKSITDFFSSFAISKNKERVTKEFERLSKIPHWFLVVEGTYTQIKNGIKYSRASGKDLIDHVYSLVLKYGGQLIFANGRTEASEIIQSIFKGVMK